MPIRGLAAIGVGFSLSWGCSVPLERFHRPDAASPDAPADTPTDATIDKFAQQAYVKASNTGAGDVFGRSIALSADGSTMAIGAHREASAATGIGGSQANNSAQDAGAVYVFTRNGSMWTQQAYIKASNTEMDDFFGVSVALSADGSTLVVGAYSEDSAATGVGGDQGNNSAGAAGAVYVFTRTGAVWSQQAYVKASNTGGDDAFGRSVALAADGATLAVGAYLEDSAATGINGDQSSNGATDSGAVYVFIRNGSTWLQQAYVKASTVVAFDEFGASVALSADGSTLAVGASREATAVANVGAVSVFTRTGTTWSQQAREVRMDAQGALGNSVALSADGSTLAIGASRESSQGTGAGAVYVLVRSGATWGQQAYLRAFNIAAGDEFGTSVALSADGSKLVVGGAREDSAAIGIDGSQADNSATDAGAVYMFTRSGTLWSPQFYIKASNTEPNDRFGDSVALSADGLIMAASATAEGSAATGIGNDQSDNSAAGSGAVYVFR